MNPKNLFSIFAAVAVTTAFSAQGANITKADNATTLDLGGSWTGGNDPGVSDVGVWDSTIVTVANCTNTLAASTNWGGVEILNPPAPVRINNSSSAVLALGSSGIDLNEAGSSQNLTFNLPVTTVADQTWAIKSGLLLTFIPATTISNNVTVNGHVVVSNAFNIANNIALTIPSGTVFEIGTNQSSNPMSVASDGNTGTVNQNGGTVYVSKGGGTGGSYTPSLAIGNFGSSSCIGTYNLNGGTLLDITPNTNTYCVLGNALNSTGILNINGGSAQFWSFRMGNSGGTGFCNVTNGTLTVIGGEFSIGRGSGSGGPGTMNIAGGTVSAPNIGVNVAHGTLTGTLNMSGGAFNISGSLNVDQSSGSGILNLSGGVLNITNTLNLPSGGSASATANLNSGSLVIVSSVGATGTGSGFLELNGGTLKARSNNGNFISTSNILTVHVDAGGAVIDTTNANITIANSLQSNASPDGGLTKLGTGTLTLTAPNAYNGPTLVGGGTLSLSTTNNNSFATITVSNAATLDTALASAGTSLTPSSLIDGTSVGGTVTNQFDLGGFGNPTTPVINASSLSATGTVHVVVNGTGLSVGTIPLIKYNGSVGGGGSFVLNLVAGAVGYVTNDTSAKAINLVITGNPKLTWRAQVNTNWDTITANWVDTNNAATLYVDGSQVFFDDSASNTLVNLTNGFSPATVNFNNTHSNYTFSGSGSIGGPGNLIQLGTGTVVMAFTNNSYSGNTLISNGVFQLGVKNAIPNGSGKGGVTVEGKLDLAGFNQSVNGLTGSTGVVDNSSGTAVVLGAGSGNGVFSGLIKNSGASLTLNVSGGSLLLLGTNTYSGGTTNSATLALGSPKAIGTGPLTLNGGTVSWASALPQTLTNHVVVASSTTLGNATNGLLTVQNTADFTGSSRALTCNSDVIFVGGLTNGFLGSKNGTGTLTIMNTTNGVISGSASWTGGSTIWNNCPGIVMSGGNPRIISASAALARLVLTNGTSYLMTNDTAGTVNFMLGDTDTAGDTNELDVAGTLTLAPYPVAGGNTTADALEIGTKNTQLNTWQIVNLLPGGVINARYVDKVAVVASGVISVFNFNGGTLSPNTNDFAANFLGSHLDQVNVLDGGAIVDTAGWNVTINNDLLSGGTGIGSFTKNGAGQLILAGSAGTSLYGGSTIVNAGTLTLNTTLLNSTNFFVAAGAIFDVGSLEVTSGKTIRGSGTVLGSVTVDNGATMLPGTATTIGTLTFADTAPTLNGKVLLKINTGAVGATNDQVALSTGTLAYGGSLTVTNIGPAPAPGSKFYLFSTQSGFSGSFSGGITLPTLPAGLGWTNNLINDGSITVTGAFIVVTPPKFTSAVLGTGGLIMSGTNGQAFASYRVLSSTNLLTPLSGWKVIATNNFNSGGGFIFTNTVSSTNSANFFDVVYP